MKCIYCGTTLTQKDYCPGCGADVTLQKRIVRISNLLYNQGLEKAQVRDLSGAISVLGRSLKFNKENTDARNLLGLCYYETGEVVSALVEWVISKNIRGKDNLADTYINRLQADKNKLDQYNTAIRKYNQSLAYCRQGSEDMALMQLRQVVSRSPKFVRAYQLLALLYMNNSEWEKARRLLRRASRIDNTNTTTRRYLTMIEAETGKTSLFSRRRRNADESVPAPESPRERALRYVSGNETIIAPTTFRDSSTIATIINIMLGILLGAAIVWFLTVPAVKQNANDHANKSVTDANTSLASVTATVQDLQDQVQSANDSADQAKTDAQNAQDRIDSYADLLNVADLFVKGDQTKTVEALGKLKAENYDGEGKTLYDDITAMVGDALFTQYYTAGTSAYVSGDYTESATQLQQAIDSDKEGKNSKYYDALYYLGFAYYNSGDKDKANEVFKTLSEKYPDSASVVAPYMNGGTGTSSADPGTAASQGQASMDQAGTSGTSDQTASQSSDTTSSSASGQSDITVYDNTGSAGDSSQSTPQVAWTDPTTGQNYDMYGNPIYQ